jgi:hypothetical protein
MPLSQVYLDPGSQPEPTENRLSLMLVAALKIDKHLRRRFALLYTLTPERILRPDRDDENAIELRRAIERSSEFRVDFQPSIGRTSSRGLPALYPDISICGSNGSERTFQLLVEAKLKAKLGDVGGVLQTTRYARAWNARSPQTEANVRRIGL